MQQQQQHRQQQAHRQQHQWHPSRWTNQEVGTLMTQMREVHILDVKDDGVDIAAETLEKIILSALS